MLLSGPGGTGKTHVVGAVNKLMSAYRGENRICYLAPTGGIAKIINGMTVHKGLGIAIKKKGKGKGNQTIDDDEEDYTVMINIYIIK